MNDVQRGKDYSCREICGGGVGGVGGGGGGEYGTAPPLKLVKGKGLPVGRNEGRREGQETMTSKRLQRFFHILRLLPQK